MISRLVIIAAMEAESSPRTIREIAKSTGVTVRTVRARIHDMKKLGAVSAHGVLYVGNKGRPEKLYRLNQ